MAYIPYISGTLGDTGVHRRKTEPIFIQDPIPEPHTMNRINPAHAHHFSGDVVAGFEELDTLVDAEKEDHGAGTCCHRHQDILAGLHLLSVVRHVHLQ